MFTLVVGIKRTVWGQGMEQFGDGGSGLRVRAGIGLRDADGGERDLVGGWGWGMVGTGCHRLRK